jgi:hypothetical protein
MCSIRRVWYCYLAVVACKAAWTAHGKTTAGSVCLHPITANGRVRLDMLDRHTSSKGLSCWSLGDAYRLNVVSEEIIVDEQTEETKRSDAHEKLSQLVEHLHAVAGSLRISASFLARFQRAQETINQPRGERWAVAAKHVDLSGVWIPIVTSEFKQRFDDYLVNCSLSFFHRKLLINGIALQTEYIEQRYQGKELEILDKMPVGSWNRTLVTSGASPHVDRYEARNVTIGDPHGDLVQVEAWWEDMGSMHKSWLRGEPNSYGGAIETSRYLEIDDTLVCESTFHPDAGAPVSYKYAQVVFRFKRMACT